MLDSQALSEHAPDERTKKRTKDTELTALVEAWPTLPEAIRAGILAMVRASRSKEPPAVHEGWPDSNEQRSDEP